ncbi:MAG: histidine kinase [Opitutaceae bacterium]|nr:histidine kinase [Opitutaceae bacterium]
MPRPGQHLRRVETLRVAPALRYIPWRISPMVPSLLPAAVDADASPDSLSRLGAETEVLSIPPLSESDETLLDAHSLLNGLNALVGELGLLAGTLGRDESVFQAAFDVCDRMVRCLRERAECVVEAERFDAYRNTILTTIEIESRRPLAPAAAVEAARSIATIRQVLEVLKLRSAEYLAHARAPGLWVRLPASVLREQLAEFFRVVESRARGRYGIVFDQALQGARDYFVDLRFGRDGGTLALPDALRDVARDLAANARKFTAPGGTITVEFSNRGGGVTLVVADTGRGIPAGDIPGVVHFGARGANVFDVAALGGGFGLTKAFLTTKRFGGRFWIASRLGVGTCVRIKIPENMPRVESANA